MNRIFSYGGGVQSNAVLLLQATGQLPEPFDVSMMSPEPAWITVPKFSNDALMVLSETPEMLRTPAAPTVICPANDPALQLFCPFKVTRCRPSMRPPDTCTLPANVLT